MYGSRHEWEAHLAQHVETDESSILQSICPLCQQHYHAEDLHKHIAWEFQKLSLFVVPSDLFEGSAGDDTSESETESHEEVFSAVEGDQKVSGTSSAALKGTTNQDHERMLSPGTNVVTDPSTREEYYEQIIPGRYVRTRVLDDYLDSKTQEFGQQWQRAVRRNDIYSSLRLQSIPCSLLIDT